MDRIDILLNERKSIERELQSLKSSNYQGHVCKLVERAKSFDGFKLVAAKIDSPDVDHLKQVGDLLRNELKSGVGVLASVINDKINFICVVTDDLIKNNKLNAGDIVKQVAAEVGGSGGGRPHMALAGGKEVQKIDAVLDQVESIIREKMKKV